MPLDSQKGNDYLNLTERDFLVNGGQSLVYKLPNGRLAKFTYLGEINTSRDVRKKVEFSYRRGGASVDGAPIRFDDQAIFTAAGAHREAIILLGLKDDPATPVCEGFHHAEFHRSLYLVTVMENLGNALIGHPRMPTRYQMEVARSADDFITRFDKIGGSHRDIKPGNMLLHITRGKVIDFGIARCKRFNYLASRGWRYLLSDPKARDYENGLAIGVIDHMARETLSANHRGKVSDKYSLATSLFYVLFNKFPFLNGNPTAQELADKMDGLNEISDLERMLRASLAGIPLGSELVKPFARALLPDYGRRDFSGLREVLQTPPDASALDQWRASKLKDGRIREAGENNSFLQSPNIHRMKIEV